MNMREGCYWRFYGKKEYRYGYPTSIRGTSLVRMGFWNGDESSGKIVDPKEIEVKIRR